MTAFNSIGVYRRLCLHSRVTVMAQASNVRSSIQVSWKSLQASRPNCLETSIHHISRRAVEGISVKWPIIEQKMKIGESET